MEREEFLKLLPKLIREDDEIKGAIITALSGVVATKEDIQRVIETSNTRFEAMDKRFEAMDRRFEALLKEMSDRFEAVDRRFEALLKEMNDRFEAMQRQIDKRFEKVYERFDQMDIGYSNVVEGMAYSVVRREFKQRGLDIKLKIRHHFTDKDNIVHPDTQDIEIDIFHFKPNIIGEATLKVSKLDKIRTLIRKIEFIEKFYGEKFQRYFVCFKIDDVIKGEVVRLLEKYNIELITPKVV